MKFKSKMLLLTAGTLLTFAASASAEILFFSSQANTVEEADAVRNTVVSSFSDKVDFIAVQEGPWTSRIQVEGKADKGDAKIGLIMGLHGQLSGLQTNLDTVDDVMADEALAGVRSGNPALVEPLSNLDALLRLEMRAELKTILNETKTTTIYVTHDQVEAMSLADRIAVMNDSIIQQYANPTEIYHNPATEFIGGFIGNPPMNFLGLANFPFIQPPAGADRGGVRPENVEVSKEGLQDSWEARITVIESLGPHQQLWTTINGEKVRITVENDLGLGVGDSIYIKPILEKIKWYDRDGKII